MSPHRLGNSAWEGAERGYEHRWLLPVSRLHHRTSDGCYFLAVGGVHCRLTSSSIFYLLRMLAPALSEVLLLFVTLTREHLPALEITRGCKATPLPMRPCNLLLLPHKRGLDDKALISTSVDKPCLTDRR